MLAEFRHFPSVLSIYMSGQLEDAMEDMTAHGEDPPADLYERFLSWTQMHSKD